MSEHQPERKANLNTLLVSISLAVMVWVGNTSYNNAIKLAEIGGSLMSRAEIEAKLAINSTEIKRLDVQIQEVKLEISKLKSNTK